MQRFRQQVRDLRHHYERTMADAFAGADTLPEARLALPPRSARLHRFGYGLALPVALARTVLADQALRRRYLRVVGVQFAITVTVGVLVALALLSLGGGSGDGLVVDKEHLHLHVSVSAAMAFWSLLYATLCGAEWLVLALSRDYHAALASDLCRMTGIPPEDEAVKPAIRLDFKWLFRKLKSRARGFIVFGFALPVFALIADFGTVGRTLSAVLLTLWSVYWAGAFTAAKTAHGWTDEDRAPEPVFLRAWHRGTRPLPRVIRWLPAMYGRIWGWATRSVFAPASRFEASPYELSGLALFRVVRHVPGLYLLLRPLFGVAAAHVVLGEERRRAAEADEEGVRIAAMTAPLRVAEPEMEGDAAPEVCATEARDVAAR